MALVPLADVKGYLGIVDSTGDTVLQGILNAAETALSHRLGGNGTFASTTVTQRAAGRGNALVLNYTPVISVTSVTGSFGDTLSTGDLDVDLEHGIIHYLPFLSVPFIEPFYTVVYQTGYTSLSQLPSDVVLAVKELVRHLWESQRGPGRAGRTPPAEAQMAYAMPNRVLELISPYQSTGFA